jgi:hypothetical protein
MHGLQHPALQLDAKAVLLVALSTKKAAMEAAQAPSDGIKNGDDGMKFVAVGDDLGNGSVHAEVETSLDLELGDFFPNVVDHPVQLMKMLLMNVDNVSQKISFLLLHFNG